MKLKMNGRTLVDATEPMEAMITAADCAKAVPTDPTACAIAQSLQRRKGIHSVSVGNATAYVVFVKRPDEVVRYNLPRNERALIKAFDKSGGDFPPGFKVTLGAIPERRKQGYRAGKSGTNKRSGKGSNALHRAGGTRQAPTRHVAAPA